MIKKKFVFTFIDDTTETREIPVEFQQKAPLGAGANDQFYGDIAFQACMMGFVEKSTASKQYCKIKMPMSVKHVEIIFEDTSKQAEA